MFQLSKYLKSFGLLESYEFHFIIATLGLGERSEASMRVLEAQCKAKVIIEDDAKWLLRYKNYYILKFKNISRHSEYFTNVDDGLKRFKHLTKIFNETVS